MTEEVKTKCKQAKDASLALGRIAENKKNNALLAMAEAVDSNIEPILSANKKDIEYAKDQEISKTVLDRIFLDEKRVRAIAESIRSVARLPDPVGTIHDVKKRPNGLMIGKMRIPIGTIGMVYEARPNVTADATCLCLKSGNAVVLRGGAEAINSNIEIWEIVSRAAYKNGIPEGAIQLIETTDRSAVMDLIKCDEYLDVIIPRGGNEFINMVVKNATVPVIKHGIGNCHTYVDEFADLEKARRISFNAKVQRPGVCNAMETLLVHSKVSEKFIPSVFKDLKKAGVELRGCEKTRKIDPNVKIATDKDWFTEYLDLILAVKVVDSIDSAISHINKYGSSHSDVIVTDNHPNAMRFLKEVDSSAVYVNASTRFTDGGEFGLGAEIGISTQKLHARGPMALEELTTLKFIIFGDGQIRT